MSTRRGGVIPAAEWERVSDLLDEYFQAVRAYNLALGAFDMTPDELRDARAREALFYAKVQTLKRRLEALGVAV